MAALLVKPKVLLNMDQCGVREGLREKRAIPVKLVDSPEQYSCILSSWAQTPGLKPLQAARLRPDLFSPALFWALLSRISQVRMLEAWNTAGIDGFKHFSIRTEFPASKSKISCGTIAAKIH